MLLGRDDLIDLSEALAFIGNSLLSPMSQTGSLGIEPAFWDEFPDFGGDSVREAIASCRAHAASVQELACAGDDPVQRVSVEFTKLFVGPPHPAAAPWETYYQAPGDSAIVGFGQPTFEMQALLRGAGLEMANDNNQYADHMGIELLLASVLFERAATGVAEVAEAVAFVREHPAAWIGEFSEKVRGTAPEGYFAGLLELAASLLDVAAQLTSADS